jgi:N-succinyl-L-ornithine transcarbamylase
MRNFLSVEDVSDVDELIDQALTYKKAPLKDGQLGQHKTIGMLFMNPSMRTRISTQLAARNLGMEVLVFNINKEGWQLEFSDGAIMDGNTAEHVKEAAAVMGQYFDILAIRTFPGLQNKEEDYGENYIRQFVRHAGIPVVSLESATLHPLQSLADLMTIRESLGDTTRRPKVVMTWAPHIKALPQAVPNSFAQWINAWDRCDLVIAHPEGYELDRRFTGKAEISHDQDKALEGADFVYVKNWSSYEQYGKVICSDASWKITLDKLGSTRQARVMHCLPVRRNLVIADEVLDSDHSIVVREAGNRVWAAQAVLSKILSTL